MGNGQADDRHLTGGVNFANGKGATTATLKAVYSGDTVYFLVQYADPTNSIRRGPFQKQADGTWKKLKDPNDKGGDDNVYYEDKWAMIWNINDSIVNFDKKGCAVACHVGEGKPYGNKYLSQRGSGRRHVAHEGQPHGAARQGRRPVPRPHALRREGAPNAGRKSDPGGPEYKGFDLVNGKPEFMNKDAKPANVGGTYYIVDGNQVPFDDGKFKPGDEVASFFIYPLKGDRGDVNVATRWANGVLHFRGGSQAHHRQQVRRAVQ